MRTSGTRAIAFTVCLFKSFAICKPLTSPQTVGSWPLSTITILSDVGTLLPQTITDSSQIVTFYETSTTATTTLRFSSAGAVYTQGCLITTISSPGTYTIESVQQIDYYCPYSTYNLFNICPLCQKEVGLRLCSFGTCDQYSLALDPSNPTSTLTSVISIETGYGCTPTIAGGGWLSPIITASVTPEPIASLPFTTTTVSGCDFTVTIANTVIVAHSISSGSSSLPHSPPTITHSPPPLPTMENPLPGISISLSLPIPLLPLISLSIPIIPLLPSISLLPKIPLPIVSVPASGPLPRPSVTNLNTGTPLPPTATPSHPLSTIYIPNDGGIITEPWTVLSLGTTVVYAPYTTVLSYFIAGSGGVASTITGSDGTITQVAPYAEVTSYVPNLSSAYSTAASGTLYFITAYTTTTIYLYNGGTPSTSTASGSVIVSVPNNSCNNSGLHMDVYSLTSDIQDDDAIFSKFDLSTLQNSQAVIEDTSTSPFFACITNPCDVLNATNTFSFDPTFKAIVYHGYFVAQATGVYTFSSKYIDDILLVWFGSFALSGFTRANANLLATYGTYPGNNEVHSFSKSLAAGSFSPIKIIYGNGMGVGTFELDVTGPNGQPLALTGNNLVQFSCDGSSPAY